MAAQGDAAYGSAREVVYVLFRYKWLILTVFVVVSVSVTAVTYIWPASYESEARLLMRIGRQSLPGDPSIPNTLVNVTQDRTNEVKSILAILSSTYLAEKVVDSIGEGWILNRPDLKRADLPLEIPEATGMLAGAKGFMRLLHDTGKDILIRLHLREDLEPYEEAVKTVMTDLKVDWEKQTNVINLSYVAHTPALARVVLDTLVNAFLERHIEVFAAQAKPEFFQEQASELAVVLSSCEDELEAFKDRFGIVELTKQKEALIDQLGAQEAAVAEAAAGVKALEAQVAALEGIVKAAPERHETSRVVGRPNFAVDEMLSRLIGLRIEEADLTARYPDDYRPLEIVREKLDRVEREIAKHPPTLTEVTTGLDANREGWEHTMENERANLAARTAQRDSLQQEADRLNERLTELASHEMEYVRLARNRDLAEAEYKQHLENLQRASLSDKLDTDKVSNVSIVDSASQPMDPVSPRKIRDIFLGLLLGLFGGIALAFILEFLDDSLNTIEETERRLGLPVLASVSEKDFKSCI